MKFNQIHFAFVTHTRTARIVSTNVSLGVWCTEHICTCVCVSVACCDVVMVYIIHTICVCVRACVLAYVLCTLCIPLYGMPYLKATNCTVCRRLFHSFNLAIFLQPIHFQKIQKIFGFFPLEFSYSPLFCFVVRFHIFKWIAAYIYPFKFIPLKWIPIAYCIMVMVIIA